MPAVQLLLPAAEPSEVPPVARKTLGALALYTLLILLLLVMTVVGLLLLRRALRMVRDRVSIAPRRPTPMEDVWSMHKVPPWEPDEDEPGGNGRAF